MMRTLHVTAAALAAALLLAACGGSADTTDQAVDDALATADDVIASASDAMDDVDLGDVDLAGFCASAEAVTSAQSPEIGGMDDEQARQAVQEFYRGFEPTVQELVDAAPEQIREQTTTMLEAVQRVASSGDPDDLGDEVAQAAQELRDFTTEACPS